MEGKCMSILLLQGSGGGFCANTVERAGAKNVQYRAQNWPNFSYSQKGSLRCFLSKCYSLFSLYILTLLVFKALVYSFYFPGHGLGFISIVCTVLLHWFERVPCNVHIHLALPSNLTIVLEATVTTQEIAKIFRSADHTKLAYILLIPFFSLVKGQEIPSWLQ